MARLILLAIVAVFWLADDARAYDEWSGGCKATVSISPEAQATYGPEISSALGRISQATGIGSTARCGMEACPPFPSSSMETTSAAARIGPARPATAPSWRPTWICRRSEPWW